jgi:hypothetical protein
LAANIEPDIVGLTDKKTLDDAKLEQLTGDDELTIAL